MLSICMYITIYIHIHMFVFVVCVYTILYTNKCIYSIYILYLHIFIVLSSHNMSMCLFLTKKSELHAQTCMIHER